MTPAETDALVGAVLGGAIGSAARGKIGVVEGAAIGAALGYLYSGVAGTISSLSGLGTTASGAVSGVQAALANGLTGTSGISILSSPKFVSALTNAAKAAAPLEGLAVPGSLGGKVVTGVAQSVARTSLAGALVSNASIQRSINSAAGALSRSSGLSVIGVLPKLPPIPKVPGIASVAGIGTLLKL